ncbi:PKD-like family lipoprotein [Proteiniphilum sp. UBA5384]|uniref:PKD-like family lipoprotein n=1 Tax=Proteiniphilum sp. UBA5384 TaxID=1947279 RepID=UPI0025D9B8DF|nr:PKD-like family lipoprotein [Proteiniphilum sp. UBA5384]
MKNIYIFLAFFVLLVFYSCYKDDGNYDYLQEEQVSIIEIDTVGNADRFAFVMIYNPGDTIRMAPRVKYAHPENLKYAWITYPYPYEAVQVGNAMVYPKADTIARTLEVEWEVTHQPGWYNSGLLVTDTVRGLSAQMLFSYFRVNKPGAREGVYILSEYDRQSDIDFYTSQLCLIYGDDSMIPNYYSETTRGEMLPGKPLFISYGQDYYYVFTEQGGYRLNTAGLELMEDWDQMFYNTPSYKPQALNYINNCEFLVNNGKLHVLYTNKTNDRKFSAPIGGDYSASPFLSDRTRASYGAISGAINSDQVIFDEKSLGFRPYFSMATEVGEFMNTIPDAYINAKRLPSNPWAIKGGEGGKTYAILEDEGSPYLYILNFYNVIDDGDLSGNGVNSIIDLSGCTNIRNLKFFDANINGTAFFYATDKGVYSFTPSSGQINSTTLYECAADEEVTCISVFAGHAGGGFPTAGAVLWIGVWNESGKTGKLVEFEVDAYSGLARQQWGAIFAPTHSNPHITTGFGKIKSITTKF